MKVTPINRKFGKYEIGQVFNLPDKAAKIYIKLKKLQEVVELPALTTKDEAQSYSHRMMVANSFSSHTVVINPVAGSREVVVADSVAVQQAPYGYKADGTPRLRPSRHPVKE